MKADVLEAIIKFTDHAHGDQKRKYSDERYIVHPIRVMQTCQQYSHDPAVLAAALLHDVLEDTPVTRAEIREFLSSVLTQNETERALSFIEDLTDVYIKKDYPRMDRRTRKQKEAERLSRISPHAQTIKYADIIDNAQNIVSHDHDFGYVYLKEAEMAVEMMKDGHPALHQRVTHTVRECLDKVKKVEL